MMRLRNYPAIMRMHASRKKDGFEQFYSEMQLFHPWRAEVLDLHPSDPNKCTVSWHASKKNFQKKFWLGQKLPTYVERTAL